MVYLARDVTKSIGIKASCTWGDGPDVLLVLEGRELLLYAVPRLPGPDNIMNPITGSKTNFGKKLAEKAQGYVNEGSLCLTAVEARILADQLYEAAKQAENLERSYKDLCERLCVDLPDPKTLTCYRCNQRNHCDLVDDPYNTDGKCLAMK